MKVAADVCLLSGDWAGMREFDGDLLIVGADGYGLMGGGITAEVGGEGSFCVGFEGEGEFAGVVGADGGRRVGLDRGVLNGDVDFGDGVAVVVGDGAGDGDAGGEGEGGGAVAEGGDGGEFGCGECDVVFAGSADGDGFAIGGGGFEGEGAGGVGLNEGEAFAAADIELFVGVGVVFVEDEYDGGVGDGVAFGVDDDAGDGGDGFHFECAGGGGRAVHGRALGEPAEAFVDVAWAADGDVEVGVLVGFWERDADVAVGAGGGVDAWDCAAGGEDGHAGEGIF